MIHKNTYRGRRISDGKWVYGNLTFNSSKTKATIVPHDSDSRDEIEVDPDTVGQFTGFTDCDGKKIWEGDILRFLAYQDYGICQVKWNPYVGAFCIQFSDENKCGIKSLGIWLSEGEKVVVIGTIYDNRPPVKTTIESKVHTLSEQYARVKCAVNDYSDGVYDKSREEANSVLSWLFRTYQIINKKKANELRKLVNDNSDSLDHGLIDGLCDWIEFNLNE